MNDRLFIIGAFCAAAGLTLAQLAPQIAGTPGVEPLWAEVVLITLALLWLTFTAAAFIFRRRR